MMAMRLPNCSFRRRITASDSSCTGTRRTARFLGVGHARDRIARQRGVGGDDAIDAVARQRVGDGVDLLLGQVGAIFTAIGTRR